MTYLILGLIRFLAVYSVQIFADDWRTRIIAKVDQLMALVDQLETPLADSRATFAHLMATVVVELTAQR